MRRLLVALALVGCGQSATEPLARPDAVEFTPPAVYATLYAEMAACAGIEGDFARVRWFRVPGGPRWISTATGTEVAGEWWRPHDIYISEPHAELKNPDTSSQIILHEILHELLQSPDHPTPPFDHGPVRGCVPAFM
jgi:hypothetical protein